VANTSAWCGGIGSAEAGADGTDILETLTQNHKFIENIMRTVYTAANSVTEWFTHGKLTYLEKSFDASTHRRADKKCQ